MTTRERGKPAAVARRPRGVPQANLIERRMSRFLREPPSIRMAASVIVTATAVVVVVGGVLIRVLDHHEYPSVWVGMWWALQTVTTVGYGDVTPKQPIGRVIGAFVMLEGIAFLSIVTAAITSTFVARAERERSLGEAEEAESLEAQSTARFHELVERLDRLEAMLREAAKR